MTRIPPLAMTLVLAALLACPTDQARAIDTRDTRLLEQPDISDQHVVFVYDNDIWIAGVDGGEAHRLTTAEGAESGPHFSPDGSLIAFSGNYDGNVDVYVMPATGGAPTRLTWHGGADLVQGFTPDGRVLFSSTRYLYTDRMMQLFAVSTSGGMAERIPVPDGDDAEIAPDWSRIAYSTMPPAYKSTVPQAKNYRGGDASRIWIMDLSSYRVQEIPQPAERSNDLNPVWLDGRVFFSSDRTGEFNLFSFDPRTAAVEQLTHYRDFPILNLNGGSGALIYEQAGVLHVFDPLSRKDQPLAIAAAADLRERRPRYASDPKYTRAVAPSPDLQNVVIEYRGEILTLPVGAGPYRNLTRSTGAHDRGPAWSPDGTRVAWFSDLSGEYALYICMPDGSGQRRIELHGAGFYADLHWAPDGRWLAYLDSSRTLYVLDVHSGQARRIAQEPQHASSNTMKHTWAPDSKWLAYTINQHGLVQTVFLYSIEQQRSFAVSDPLVDTGEPVFDANGERLYVAASIDAGPVRDWFAQSRSGMKITRTIYSLALPRKATTIDVDGIRSRAVALAETTGTIRNLQAGRAGELYYLSSSSDSTALVRYSLSTHKPETILNGLSDYSIAAGGSRLLYRKGNAWQVAEIGARIDESVARTVPVDRISVLVEPAAEWRQILRESWRIKRDFFYAPNYHGADWSDIWKKYEPFIDHAATRSDVERVQYWMATELAVGHSYVFPGETIQQPPLVSVGLLGADFDVVAGRYRFARIYGSHWTPGVRAPLEVPEGEVTAGEYLLRVGDIDVRADEDLYRFFQGTVGRPTTLTVGPRPDAQGARTITVEPIDDETMLRRLDWIEGNVRKVDAATNGRVAYVYVPNTADSGLAFFKRYFYPQSHKEAIIVDARFNGGGSFADYYIDILRRAHIGWFATRHGEDLRVPRGAILGPKVLITNKMARSGGDLLAFMFRKLQLGPIVGTTTTGALVGNIGAPELMDGGAVTAPNFGLWTEEGGWAVENVGVPPDIEVEQLPAAVNAGHDPQLKKAIEAALALLAKQPAPKEPRRPPYPVRTRR